MITIYLQVYTHNLTNLLAYTTNIYHLPTYHIILCTISYYVTTGSQFSTRNTSDIDTVPDLTNLIDTWSTLEDIEKEKNLLKESINENNTAILLGSDLEATLTDRATRTISILKQIHEYILNYDKNSNSNKGSSISNEDIKAYLYRTITDMRAVQAENIALSSRVIILTHELIDMKANIHTIRVQKERYEKLLIKFNDTVAAPGNASTTTVTTAVVAASSSSSSHTAPPSSSSAAEATSTTTTTAYPGANGTSVTSAVSSTQPTLANGQHIHKMARTSDEDEELREQVELLTKQLEESEALLATLRKQAVTHAANSSSGGGGGLLVQVNIRNKDSSPTSSSSTSPRAVTLPELQKHIDEVFIMCNERVNVLQQEV